MPLAKDSSPSKLSVLAVAAALVGLIPFAARAEDADEADLLRYYEKVDVWHFSVDYNVGHNNQDAVATRELVALPPPAGQLCYIRFDLVEGVGDYSYGFKPGAPLEPGHSPAWGVYVHKRGTVLNQLRSILKLNTVYFYVEGLRDAYKSAPPEICAQKQAAPTPQAGHGYNAPIWSDLIMRAKLVHGWPQAAMP